MCILVVALIIIITGIVVIFVKGINYSLAYGENTTIELYLENDFERQDVINIITEVFGNNFETRQINELKGDILIITKSASDEQLDSLVSKTNEKFGLELTKDDLIVTKNSKISLMDLINPYISSTCISAIIILIYFTIRYKKLGVLKVIGYTLFMIICTQLIYVSIQYLYL